MSLNGIFPIDRWNFTTHSVLSVLSDQEMALLTRHVTEQRLFKGDVIFREGAVPSGIFVVRSGRVKKYKVDQTGREQIIYLAGAGELMGYHPVLSGERYADSAAAMEETMVSFIPKEDFMDMLARSPVFALRLMKAMSHEFTVLTNTISVIAQRTGPERLAIALIVLREKFKYGLNDHDAIPINISRADLANMAGLAEENVIRLLSEFKAEGILSTQGRKIIIKDIHLLVKRANYR